MLTGRLKSSGTCQVEGSQGGFWALTDINSCQYATSMRPRGSVDANLAGSNPRNLKNATVFKVFVMSGSSPSGQFWVTF